MDSSRIMQVGMSFWTAKTLLSAVELGVFTRLGKGPMTAEQLGKALGLAPRGWFDFFDALVALGFLERDGNGPQGRYRNGAEAAAFLDRNQPTYMGGFLEMCSARLYRFWGDLTEGLRTGKPQNEIKHTGKPMFAELYSQPERLEQFMQAMAGISAANFQAFAAKFDFSRYKTMADVGGATGQLSILCAQRHAHLRCTSYDLPEVEPIARRIIERAGVADRVKTASLDFFAQPIPAADVVTMGMILHDWNVEKKRQLIQAAYKALPAGGAFVAIENLIDDERRKNVFGMMMSLNMLIEFGEAFDFSGADFAGWCKEAGFKRTEVLPLQGPASAAIAYK
jgi:predicted O-methyltransferase YrrM